VLLLRWLIGLLSVLALAGFLLILTIGKGFEVYRSGAAPENFLRLAAIVGTPLLLAAMLASVFLPGSRLLLHAVAVGVALGCLLCVSIIRTNPGEGMLYLGFFGLWVLYYAFCVWGPPLGP